MKRIYKIKSSHVTTEPLLDKVICKSTILLRMIETGLEFLEKSSINLPANIRLDEDVLKTSLVFVFRRRLQDVFKTSWSRRIYSPYSYVFRKRVQDILWKRLQDVFKTFSRRLQDIFKMLWKRLQDVLKTSSRYLQGIFKTSSRRFHNVLSS